LETVNVLDNVYISESRIYKFKQIFHQTLIGCGSNRIHSNRVPVNAWDFQNLKINIQKPVPTKYMMKALFLFFYTYRYFLLILFFLDLSFCFFELARLVMMMLLINFSIRIIEALCHSRCCTIKISPCLKA
jgi:hypothetical protein